jgi:hypothetical protein
MTRTPQLRGAFVFAPIISPESGLTAQYGNKARQSA